MSQTEVQIPRDYGTWKSMISNQCKETLSPEYLNARLKVLKNASDPYTQKMVSVYGADYVKVLISWFEKAKSDLI
ncbi:MAG: hypothetical protein MI748_16640 [Opitutales bacterium]|nr:hypothetical protein [Opitutales bacterium]